MFTHAAFAQKHFRARDLFIGTISRHPKDMLGFVSITRDLAARSQPHQAQESSGRCRTLPTSPAALALLAAWVLQDFHLLPWVQPHAGAVSTPSHHGHHAGSLRAQFGHKEPSLEACRGLPTSAICCFHYFHRAVCCPWDLAAFVVPAPWVLRAARSLHRALIPQPNNR